VDMTHEGEIEIPSKVSAEKRTKIKGYYPANTRGMALFREF